MDRLLHEGNPDNVVKSLIVVPTRELAQQIDIQFQGFSYFLPLSTTVVYGGGDGIGWSQQKQGMIMGSDIVIATPGRLLAHIQNSGVDLSHVRYFVLDEADRMLDMGFFDDIMKIVAELPAQRQTVMFSATLPPKIRQLAKQILRDPSEVNIAISKPNEAISQVAYVCYENQKIGIIRELFARPSGTKTIIFSSSKLKTKELARTLKQMKLNVGAMHSDLEQEQREAVMLDFRNGKIDILVATDIVARGIDIEDIGTVINYDVPHDPEDYIHRIGRTAVRVRPVPGSRSSANRNRINSSGSRRLSSGRSKSCRFPNGSAKGRNTIRRLAIGGGAVVISMAGGRVKGAEVPVSRAAVTDAGREAANVPAKPAAAEVINGSADRPDSGYSDSGILRYICLTLTGNEIRSCVSLRSVKVPDRERLSIANDEEITAIYHDPDRNGARNRARFRCCFRRMRAFGDRLGQAVGNHFHPDVAPGGGSAGGRIADQRHYELERCKTPVPARIENARSLPDYHCVRYFYRADRRQCDSAR